jgi:hypothetical protein
MTEPKIDDMPVFVIKAKDALALQAVIAYRDLCDGHGLREQAAQVQLALVEMAGWRAEHEDLIKMPDHPHLPVGAALSALLAIGYRAAAEVAESRGAVAERARLIAAVRGPAADLLLQHQRDGIKPCPCGQVGLGRSHTAHLAAVIATYLEGLPQR